MIGHQIGNYRIDSEHGRGAMGVAYLATDTRLDRPAILKLPIPELLAQSHARDRFEREARAASALDHPNICTIYQVGETETPGAGSQIYIAMAYYPGETLADTLSRGAIAPHQVVDWIGQIASGLQTAHQHGVIHRDVKAANIIITEDGVAKILDFGLAKLQGLPDPTSETMIGTPAYLDPEILRGQDADERSDQFSLAALTYEMLTGQVPFAGLRGPALLNALLNREPDPPSAVGALSRLSHSELHETHPEASAPINLDATDRVILRSLDKEPSNRFSCVSEFANQLSQALGYATEPEQAPKPSSKLPQVKGWLAIALSLTALLALSLGWSRLNTPLKTPSILRTAPLTRVDGLEKSPSFSPDGKQLVFASDELGNMDIWIRRLGSTRTVPLTADHEGYDDFPKFSPDGRWIAFVSDREGGGIFLMSALGGPPRKVFSIPFMASQESPIWVPSIAFSPDGRKLVIGEASTRRGLLLVEVSSRSSELLPKPEAIGDVTLVQPAFSPDGENLVMVALEGGGTTSSAIWRLPLDGSGTGEALTSGDHMDQYPVFSPDGRRLFFISNRGGSFDLWFMDFNDSIDGDGSQALSLARPLTTGVGLSFPALSPSGNQLVYSKVEESSNIWSADLSKRRVDFKDATQLTQENHLIEFVHPSHDLQWLVFDSNRQGNVDIWLMPREGGAPEQLTTDPAHDFCPRFSPDDQDIVFYSLRSGNRDLWVLSRQDGELRTVAPHPARDWMAQWSTDGQSIIFESNRSGNRDLWRVDAAGRQEPEQLTFHSGRDIYPVPSPDGSSLAFASNRTGSFEIHLLDLKTGNVDQLSHRGTFSILFPFSWSEDGSEIYAQAREAGLRAPNLWAVQLADGSSSPQTNFQTTRLQLFESLSVLNQTAFFPVRERQGDLWLADLRFE